MDGVGVRENLEVFTQITLAKRRNEAAPRES